MAAEVPTGKDHRRVLVAENQSKIAAIVRSSERSVTNPFPKKLTTETAGQLLEAARKLTREDALRELGMEKLHRGVAAAVKKAPKEAKGALVGPIFDEIIEKDEAAETGNRDAINSLTAAVDTAEFLGIDRGISEVPELKTFFEAAREKYNISKVFKKGKGVSRRAIVKGLAATALVTASAGALWKTAEMKGELQGAAKVIRQDLEDAKRNRQPAPPSPSPGEQPTQVPPTPGTEPAATARPVEASPTPKPEIKLPEVGTSIPEFIRPLMETIIRNREMRSPESNKRIDLDLNKNKITFVVHNRGESHEPPVDRTTITSTSWFVWDLSTGIVDDISITHDVRVPNAERKLKQQGRQNVTSVKIDHVYEIGGIPLLAEVAEDITGLYADVVFVSDDNLVVDGIDRVFGTIPVDVPRDFKVHPYWLNGQKYPAGEFKKGVENMDGKRALQFIKTMPREIEGYPVELNHNNLKKRVKKGAMDYVGKVSNFTNQDFWIKTMKFLADAAKNKSVDLNVEPTVLLDTIDHIISRLPQVTIETASGKLPLPSNGTSTYISDEGRGDGGLNWVTSRKDVDPKIKADLEKGMYPDQATKVPQFADPYAYDDLTNKYWKSTRKLIKERLSKPKR